MIGITLLGVVGGSPEDDQKGGEERFSSFLFSCFATLSLG
jgi:hypothetical protein